MTAEAESKNGLLIDVLICDDHPAIRAALRDVISLREALRVIGEAADGNEAINQAKRLQPDVILLDLAMPNMTGYEALLELRIIVPKTRIVVFSALPAASLEAAVLERGAVLYLQKGGTPDEINDAIEHAANSAEPQLSMSGTRRSGTTGAPR